MAEKEKSSTQSEKDMVGSGGPTSESLVLKLSDEQRQTIRKYVELPAHLSRRLAARGTEAKDTAFTLDDLDELLDMIEDSVYRAKGNERQKVLRIAARVSKLLGSTIDPDEMPQEQLPNRTDTVFQIKMTLRGIAPPIWRRIQTKDCTLDEIHALIQVAMGWEFEHPYSFRIGGVEYAHPEMVRDDIEDACATKLSEVLPVQNRRPRFGYVYDFGDEWLHQLIVEERFSPEAGVNYPRCLAGSRACPPEDCGGRWAYFGLVEALSSPDHRRHAEMLEWVGGGFDPEKFDLEAVNKKLQRMD